MKSTLTLAVLGGVLLSTSLTAPVLAATKKPASMTCDEYVLLDDVVRPKVVYWAEGFNAKDQPDAAVVDIAATDNLVPVLVDECRQTPGLSFWQKLKSHL
jgi:hypothetical protein